MKASVVIPSYNCLNLLRITVKSLEQQDVSLSDFEVIIIDDGSTDGTGEYLKTYRGKINLIPVINPKNLGRATSRNRGISKASNELVIFLDSDIEVKSDFIRIHMGAQTKGACVSVGKVVHHPELRSNRLMRYLDNRGSAKVCSGTKIPGKYFRTTNASAPLNVLDEIGRFDEDFISYGGEDTELGLRLERKLPIYSLPEAIGYNRHLRQLEDLLGIIHIYGEQSLPVLFYKHPEFKIEMKMNHIGKKSFVNLILMLCCSAPVYNLLKYLAKKDMTPKVVYTYLLYRSSRNGYLRSLKSGVAFQTGLEKAKLNPVVK
jgi:glycosyltransferase involved in cell wall biosynthesis